MPVVSGMFLAIDLPAKFRVVPECRVAVDIDTVLLDRVFQPCVNVAAGMMSCFALARAALAVAVEAQTLVLFWDAIDRASAFSMAFSAFAAVLTLVGAQQAWKTIARAERQGPVRHHEHATDDVCADSA